MPHTETVACPSCGAAHPETIPYHGLKPGDPVPGYRRTEPFVLPYSCPACGAAFRVVIVDADGTAACRVLPAAD